jgi:hypothetical protein
VTSFVDGHHSQPSKRNGRADEDKLVSTPHGLKPPRHISTLRKPLVRMLNFASWAMRRSIMILTHFAAIRLTGTGRPSRSKYNGWFPLSRTSAIA